MAGRYFLSTETTHLTMPSDIVEGPQRLEWFYQNVFQNLPRHHPVVDGNLANFGVPFAKGEFRVNTSVLVTGTKETRLVGDGPLELALKMTEYPDGRKQFERLASGLRNDPDDPSYISWHPNGALSAEKCYVAGRLHADGKPAILLFFEDGTKGFEGWVRRDIYTRDGAPAWISYRPDGTVRKQKWYKDGICTQEQLF